MQRRLFDVRQVHRDLGDPIFLHKPADRLDVFQHPWNANWFAVRIQNRFPVWRTVLRFDAALLSNIESDGIRASHRFRVQVHIVSDQKIAHANHGRARFLVENRRAEIRFPLALFDFVKEALVFPRANYRKICARFIFRRSFVEINRDIQFLANALSQLV